MRGFLVRRKHKPNFKSEIASKMKEASRNLKASGKIMQLSKIKGGTRIVYAKMLTEMPDYSNTATKQSEASHGPFRYDDQFYDDDTLITRGPYELGNSSVYQGQWSREGLREGKGVQIWPDGARFEGHWKNDMANGRGRLIHADGDVYEGMWVNDKAHGKGVYVHMNGARY